MSDTPDRPTNAGAPPPPAGPGPGVPRSGPFPIGPLVLIAVGVLLLAANLGWFSWGDLGRLLSLWPVALIAVGVDIFTAGRYRLLVIAGAVVVALLLWSGTGGTRGAGSWFGAPGPAAETVDVRHDLAGATAGRVTLDLGVGRVVVDGEAPSGVLVEGTIRTGRGETIRQTADTSGAVRQVRIASAQAPGLNVGAGEDRRWELSLSRQVPVELSVSAGVGQTTIDLSRVQLTGVVYRGGVGESTVTLPPGSYDGSFDMGVGSATIELPRGAAVRLVVSTGLGRVNVTGGLRRDGNVYTSDGYEGATDRITLRVNGGVGSIDVHYR